MEKKFTMAPFDLERAKAGEPVCTRDGKDARIICWDRKGKYPIVAVIGNAEDSICSCTLEGQSLIDIDEPPNDLMMKVAVKESFVFAEVAGEVTPFEELKAEGLVDLKSLEYLIIKTHDGKYLKVWKHNLPAAEFEAAQKAAAEIGEGWRCPTRHECIDIYDTRFRGLDEAMNEIGGDDFKKCYWTCEADSDPQYNGYNAVFFHGNSGYLDTNKFHKYSVRPVLAFEIEDNSLF